jgi:adenylate cyclase
MPARKTGAARKSGAAKPGRVAYPIGLKLVSIITILLLVSLGAITALVSVLVSSDVRLTAENNNFTVNQRSSSQAEQTIRTVELDALVLLDTLKGLDEETSAHVAASFFTHNTTVTAILITGVLELFNEALFAASALDTSLAEAFLATARDSEETAQNGQEVLRNATPIFTVPMLALFAPWDDRDEEGSVRRAAVIFFSPERISETFGAGANATFMVNGMGDVMVHSDADLVRQSTNLAEDPFVSETLTSERRNFQSVYTDLSGVRYFGAFQKLAVTNAAVITTIQYDLVLEGVVATTRRNIYLTGAVLFIAILFVWFFSKSISVPLKGLATAARKIEQGVYTLDLRAKNRDEIGLLTRSFVSMSHGLEERAILMDTFARFTNRDLVERSLRGEVSLGGESKIATVFFSDIRSFTAISEKLTPVEVVEFLNDYMTRMVECVNKTGGVVDKYIGDSVMAVWGASDTSGSVAQDAFNCVRSALMMRRALLQFNQGRGGVKKPIIRIGCGINTGPLVAGQIGSKERMEYTVIGDAVNLASRTEALNKPLHTDILITEDTWHLVHDRVITEEMPPVTVKGKEKPVRMFAVVNMRVNTPGMIQPRPTTLTEVRRILGISGIDVTQVDTDAEEKKYKLGGDSG